jgi:cytoskeletal protein CcmA (bactofilin family)
MAIWKEQNTFKKEDSLVSFDPAAKLDPIPKREPDARLELAPSFNAPVRAPEREARESLIAADLTIEGKIEGSGHVRIAGRFKGDVHVDGNLSLDAGAKLTGGVRANTVVIGGEMEGNISEATRVELLASGVLTGDLKAGSLTVAAGSRMRGQVEFGWDDTHKNPARPGLKVDGGSPA